jgi:hypothetical protein
LTNSCTWRYETRVNIDETTGGIRRTKDFSGLEHKLQPLEGPMIALRQTVKPVSVVVIISMLSLVVPYQPCLAALIGTETVLDVAKGHETRENINRILAREDVQMVLRAQGISPEEAKARVNALSDAEVVALEKKLNQLPAGGDGLGAVVFALLLVFVILLVTDITGYTDVFPFVKKTVKK